MAELPTEWGVYIPTGTRTDSGPNVFVLYGDYWRCSPHPDGGDGRHWALNAMERWGLTKVDALDRDRLVRVFSFLPELNAEYMADIVIRDYPGTASADSGKGGES